MASELEFSLKVVRAVKAELARRDYSGADLVSVLELNRNAIYSRLKGQVPFDTDELAKISGFLGISVNTLFASAALEDEEVAA